MQTNLDNYDDDSWVDFRGARPCAASWHYDEDILQAQALKAIEAVPEALRGTLVTHLQTGTAAREPWIFRNRIHVKSARLPARLSGYLDMLEQRIAGPDGEGLQAFVDWVFVRTQSLSLAYLARPQPDLTFTRMPERQALGFFHYLPGSRTQLRGAASNRRIMCPFHREQTASMVFSLSSRQWHCHGCGASETHWSMVSRCLGLDRRDAVDILRRAAQFHAPPWPLPSPRRNLGLKLWGWTLPRAII